jgi:delta24(24(1))-sterol reductase
MSKRFVSYSSKDTPINLVASTDTNQHNVVDGWQPGKDPKVDHSGGVEFGGSLGTGAMIVGFPLLMYYMWIGAKFYDGQLPLPTATQSCVDFIQHLGNLVFAHAFPTLKAWKIYWTFLIFEAACYCFLPGVWGYGKPLEHEGSKQLN